MIYTNLPREGLLHWISQSNPDGIVEAEMLATAPFPHQASSVQSSNWLRKQMEELDRGEFFYCASFSEQAPAGLSDDSAATVL